MNQFTRPDWFASKLRAAICDYFVRVGVGACARTSLKNVERKMIVEFSLDDFLGCLHDQRGPLRIEQAKIMIGLRGPPFDQAQGANKRPRKPIAAHWKVKDRAVCGGTMQRRRRQGHLAHRVFFCARRPVRHAELSAPTPIGVRCAARYSRSEERRVGKECRSRWSP